MMDPRVEPAGDATARSPDGAERHPGFAPTIPDFAALNPGYFLWTKEITPLREIDVQIRDDRQIRRGMNAALRFAYCALRAAAPRTRAGSSGGKRAGANGARSTRRAAPSRISSLIASPVAGALSMPQTL
jgi:hypothetical protein